MMRDEVTTMHHSHPHETSSEPNMVYLNAASFFLNPYLVTLFPLHNMEYINKLQKNSSNLENEPGES